MKRKTKLSTLQTKSPGPKIMRPVFTPTPSTSKLKETPIKKEPPASRKATRELPKLKNPFDKLPLLAKTKGEEANDLFRKKCRQCCTMCDFSGDRLTGHISAKEDILKEILKAVDTGSVPMIKTNYEAVFALISAHLLRTPKPPPAEWFSPSDFYFSTDELRLSDWRHVSLVYDIAIAFFKSKMDNIDEQLEQYCGDLIKLVVFLTRTCDKREQDKIVTLLHSLCLNVPSLRTFTISVLTTALFRITHDNLVYVTARPLLRVLQPIVKGFRLPLRLEHIEMFRRVILPLYRCPFLAYFHDELFSVVVEFMQQQNDLVLDVYRYIIGNWPFMQPQKQMLFLKDIGWLASFVSEHEVNTAMYCITPQLMTSLCGCHAAVAETVLRLWEIGDFVWLVTYNSKMTYPIIVPKIYQAAVTHWHAEIRCVATAVLQVLRQNDVMAFDSVGVTLKQIASAEALQSMTKGKTWAQLIHHPDISNSVKRTALSMVRQLFVGCETV